jgi:hypothetical protein
MHKICGYQEDDCEITSFWEMTLRSLVDILFYLEDGGHISTEMLVNIYQTARRHILENNDIDHFIMPLSF